MMRVRRVRVQITRAAYNAHSWQPGTSSKKHDGRAPSLIMPGLLMPNAHVPCEQSAGSFKALSLSTRIQRYAQLKCLLPRRAECSFHRTRNLGCRGLLSRKCLKLFDIRLGPSATFDLLRHFNFPPMNEGAVLALSGFICQAISSHRYSLISRHEPLYLLN
jgi:hypothetical protein